MKTGLEQLDELLNQTSARLTFSRYCISGIVSDCACSRCLTKKGIAVTEETTRLSAERSQIETAAFRRRQLDWASENWYKIDCGLDKLT